MRALRVEVLDIVAHAEPQIYRSFAQIAKAVAADDDLAARRATDVLASVGKSFIDISSNTCRRMGSQDTAWTSHCGGRYVSRTI